MPPTAQRAGFVTGGRRLSGSASACAQTQAESAVTPGGPRCVAGTQANRREVLSGPAALRFRLWCQPSMSLFVLTDSINTLQHLGGHILLFIQVSPMRCRDFKDLNILLYLMVLFTLLKNCLLNLFTLSNLSVKRHSIHLYFISVTLFG